MRNEANKEVMIKMEEIKEEIIDHVEQAEERLRQQIAEGNEQIMGTLQELRKQMLPPLLATVEQHGQSPPPVGSAPARLVRLPRARLAALGSSVRRGRGRSHWRVQPHRLGRSS